MPKIKFQSTPPVSGRRCPSKGGLSPESIAVSIHAPRFREAMHGGADEAEQRQDVSIHAPRFREAVPTAPAG